MQDTGFDHGEAHETLNSLKVGLYIQSLTSSYYYICPEHQRRQRT
jgi:hypothetical protein